MAAIAIAHGGDPDRFAGQRTNTPTWLRQARHRVRNTSGPGRVATTGLAFRVLPHGVDLLGLLRKFAHRFSDAPVKGVRQSPAQNSCTM